VLVLHGADDPILPPALRAAAFPGAARVELAGHGHLLPLCAPQWCAAQIRTLHDRQHRPAFCPRAGL
jgi:pimeloyl-ACP methyl ester carboxylesterase